MKPESSASHNRTSVNNEGYSSNLVLGSTLNKRFPNTDAVTTLDGMTAWNSEEGVQFAYARAPRNGRRFR